MIIQINLQLWKVHLYNNNNKINIKKYEKKKSINVKIKQIIRKTKSKIE